MPIINVQMMRGRTPEQLRALIRGLAEATIEALAVPEQSIRIVVNEVDPDHWGMGRISRAERDRDAK